jgi:hypothetical protein
MSDQYDATWTASADELAALQDLQAQLAAQREQTAADRGAALAELQELAGARGDVQTQTRGLEGDVGSFRAEQKLAADAAGTATAELVTAGGGDFYSPDVGQTIAPDGTVTYDFDAHLHARGVDIDAADSSSPPTDRQLRWLRTSDGALIANLDAYIAGAKRFSRHFVHGTSSEAAEAVLVATKDGTTGHDCYLSAQVGNLAYTSVIAGNYGRILLDENGTSDYLNAARVGQRNRVDYGSFVYTFPGAISNSPLQAVAHSLGVLPTIVLATCSGGSNGSSGYYADTAYFNNASTVSFVIHASGFVPPAGVMVPVSWLAIA